MNEGVTIDRSKKTIPNIILEKFIDENNIQTNAKPTIDKHITYVDILYVILERGKSNSDCRKIISKINDRSTMSEIVGLLIVKNRFSLMVEIDVGYDARFVEIAIENDIYDIVFYFKDKYPQHFTQDEGIFSEPILLSFTKSNH
jgi:hypothetical protein